MSRKSAGRTHTSAFTFPLSGWIDGFLGDCRAAGLSPRTMRQYVGRLADFRRWADEQGYTELDALQPRAVQQYALHLLDDGDRQVITVRQYLRIITVFANWLVKSDALDKNPLPTLKLPRVPFRQTKPATDEQIRALLRVCERDRSEAGLRDTALILVMLDTGLRVSELLQMRVSELGPTGEVQIIGKGNKQRTVRVYPETRKAVWKYVRARREQHDVLWMGQRGPLTAGGVRGMVHRRCAQAGIPPLHPHQFRHAFAVSWIKDGGDVMSLKTLLGHESLTMVMRYVALSGEDLAAKHALHSPVKRLLGKK